METATMTEQEVLTVKTTRGELQYYRDLENWDGGIRMLNPQTIKRYKEIRNGHPDCDEYGVFFAFSREQFDEAVERLTKAGKIDEGSQIQYHPHVSGLYGTREAIRAYLDYYMNRDKAIPTDCDPQEVYFYEYNNHECMYDWDGDLEAMRLVIHYWGVEVAKNIKRYNAAKTVGQIMKEE